ncbi:MAG: DeoR family transcriptional regulator, partial [Deltaproteobacteria bacterium]|nr:DeoR family transcriptional regulator [Deltaproteobacteria bacterium]
MLYLLLKDSIHLPHQEGCSEISCLPLRSLNENLPVKEYQNNFSVSRQTATRDLTELVNRGLLALQGTGKRDAHYT